MQPADTVRVRHMLDSAREAISFAAGRTRGDLDTDRQLVLSIVKSIEILGEAASKVSEQMRNAYPQVPWQDIVRMRNRLIHAYFDINLDIVWDSVTEELPELASQLERIAESSPGDRQ